MLVVYSSLVGLLFVLSVVESLSMLPPRWQNINTTAAGLYNYQNQKCCLGSVHTSIKSNYQKCCGSNVYDSSKQLCCQDTVLDMTPASACCGNKLINTDQFLCCEDQPLEVQQSAKDLISYAKCCGKDSYYDSRSQTCCSIDAGFKVLEGANGQCCGEKLVDQNKEVCCTTFKNESISSTVVPKDGDKIFCCGSTLYDAQTEFCCNDQVVKDRGCCGTQSFNESTHLCCNNEVLDKKGKNMECCQDKPYDADAETCCYDESKQSMTPVKKNNDAQTGCCGLKPYDSNKELCCYEKMTVVPKTNKNDYECCGMASYNSQRGLCCGDVLYANVTTSTHQCCGGKPIDVSEDVCCGETEKYNTEKQVCCTKYYENGTLEATAVLDNPDMKLGCCGLETYDFATHMCCGTKIVPQAKDTSCCGDKTYDYNKEVCCTDKVFPKKTEQDACCLYGTTDAKPEYPICYPHDPMLRE